MATSPISAGAGAAAMTATGSKYQLKSVHAEIDLFDRRLAHLMKYDVFDTEAARVAAARKLTLKRDPLVLKAKQLQADGVEFHESELPRSFRDPDAPPVEKKAVVEEQVAVAQPAENRTARRQGSPYAGTSLDWEKSVQHYMEKKGKA